MVQVLPLRASEAGALLEGNAGDILVCVGGNLWQIIPQGSSGGAFPSPANPGQNGFVPRGLNGNLEYFGGAAGQIMVWDVVTGRWVAGAVPSGVTVTSLALVAGTLFEIGQTLATPAFTAAYSATPDTATLSDNDGNPAQPLVSPFTNFSSAFSYVRSSIGGSVVFTDTVTKAGFPNASRTVTAVWGARTFWGPSASAGPFNEAFIEGLASNHLAVSKVEAALTQTIGVGAHGFYCFPQSYGAIQLFDNATGFAVDTLVAASNVPVTNGFGVTINYQVIETTNANLGFLSARSA